MDDLVVIILTILIAVVGIVSQSKKRRDMQAAGNPQQKKPMDFWELLEEESNRASPFQPFGPVAEPEEESVDVAPVKKTEYQFKAQDEVSSDIVEEVKEEPRQIKKDVLIDGEKFSLRKAVIYNEIMNRKFF